MTAVERSREHHPDREETPWAGPPSTIVDAPAEEVWSLLRDFHDMSWAPDVVESCEALGRESGDELGALKGHFAA